MNFFIISLFYLHSSSLLLVVVNARAWSILIIFLPLRSRKAWLQVSNNTSILIARLMRMLKSQLDAAQRNLCLLAVDAPVYGLLSSIRLLLNDQQSR